MAYMKATAADVRKFGLTFAVLAAGLTAWSLYKGSSAWPWFAGGGLFFLITGLVGHPVLKPVYIGWMTFAAVLGWLNTRLILGSVFYIIFTPVGLVCRALRKDLLGIRPEKSAPTYWVKRVPAAFDRRRYEQLF